jgi:zinc protease
MTQATEQPRHHRLSNGIELAVLPTARRSIAAIEMRFLGGFAYENPARLGAAHLLAETLTKGTQRRDGRALNDAFDEIGASYSVSAARETLAFSCLCLPEFTRRSIELLAEMIVEPGLPAHACEVALDLTRQSLAALEDDPLELAKKHLHKQAYGDPLNRHVYGESETLDRMTRDDIFEHWRTHLRPDRLLASVAGTVDPAEIEDVFERLFPRRSQAETEGRPPSPSSFPLRFLPGRSHHPKDLEQ